MPDTALALSRMPRTPPQRLRQWAGVTLLSMLLLVWGGLAWVQQNVQRAAQLALTDSLKREALFLEEHLSRSLDSVVGTLQALALMDLSPHIRAGHWNQLALRQLALDRRLIRSVSLVNERGVVLASSNPDNLGLTVPAELRPRALGTTPLKQAEFGGTYLRRDVTSCIPCAPGSGFWAVHLDVEHEQQPYRWLLAVNTGYFENFWYRTVTEHAVQFVDMQAEEIIGWHTETIDAQATRHWVQSQLRQQETGHWQTGRPDLLQAQFRSSPAYPFAVVIGANARALDPHRALSNQQLLYSGLGFTVFLCGMVLTFLAWNRRYERTANELGNQSRGIDAHLMVSVSDPQGRIQDANDLFCAVSGYTRQELQGHTHQMFNSGLYPQEFFHELWQTVQSGQLWKGVLRNRAKDGHYFWVSATIIPFLDTDGEIQRYTAFYSDITEAIALREKLDIEHRLREELAQLNQHLQQEAMTDPLTGVANRRGYNAFMTSVMADSRRLVQPLVLLSLDLDRFKSVNDTHGHAAGDAVLREATQRWRAHLRSSDLLARLGGEEFCVVLPATTLAQGELVAQKLLDATSDSAFDLRSAGLPMELRVTVSIGLAATDTVRHVESAQLLAAADQALYHSKRTGRNRITVERLPP